MKCLIYIKKTKPYLYINPCILKTEPKRWEIRGDRYDYNCGNEPVNGKIVGEFDDKTEGLFLSFKIDSFFTETTTKEQLLKDSCFDPFVFSKEFGKYMPNYAVHIKNLNIFDKPKQLNDYFTFVNGSNNIDYLKPVKKAPQNMMKVYELKDERRELQNIIFTNYIAKQCILISFSPESACDILNGIKTIDTRRKVLKCMIGIQVNQFE